MSFRPLATPSGYGALALSMAATDSASSFSSGAASRSLSCVRLVALTIGMLAPYVLTFAALWFAGEVVWRAAEALIARAEIRGLSGH